jgi:hypothetical protein
VKNRFQILPFKCNVHRYIGGGFGGKKMKIKGASGGEDRDSSSSFDGASAAAGLSASHEMYEEGHEKEEHEAGLYKLNPANQYSLKPPGFNPCSL